MVAKPICWFIILFNFHLKIKWIWGIGHLILWHSIPNAVFFIDNLYAQQHNMMQHQLFFIFQRIFKCILWLEIEQFENFIAVIMIFWIWCTFIHTYTTVYLKVSHTIEQEKMSVKTYVSPHVNWDSLVFGSGRRRGPYLCDLSVWHSPVVSLPQCPGGWVWPPYSGEHWHTGCGPWLPPNEVEFC